jgi:glycosyltransferase involved in cell wall biosynthesis
MAASDPLVSAIIPVYNGERYLVEAVESVLAQTYRPLEILVIDDGSTDGSAEAASRLAPPVRAFLQPHSGAAAARNRGIALARGSFFAFLDADDLWLENKLALQMEAFRDRFELDAVFGHIEQFLSPDLDEDARKKIECPRRILQGRSHVTMLIRQEAFLRVGPFASDWHVGEFLDWYARAVDAGLKNLMLDAVLAKRRLHAGNMGIRMSDRKSDYVRILKSSLDRRRKRHPKPAREEE